MLFPNQTKLEIDDADHLHLLLSAETAWIPWELVTGREPSGELLDPLALRSGLLRQLAPEPGRAARPAAVRPVGKRALVIGDPPSGSGRLARLPEARREAQRVADVLSSPGADYEVRRCIYGDDEDGGRELASEIRDAFFDQHYRIVHIAAHGIIDDDDPDRSGVVIGPGQVIGPYHFAQRTVTPDLVFLNCCHLGRFDGAAVVGGGGGVASAGGGASAGAGASAGGGASAGAVGGAGTGLGPGEERPDDLPPGVVRPDVVRPGQDPHRRYPELAAQLAHRLMDTGVRAVVAAGWAIDDRAAARFADTFYEAMLEGWAFGEAVRQARRAAAEGGRSNTWGAYQCWGDPDFQLAGTRPPSGSGTPHILSAQHLVRLLRSTAQRAGDSTTEAELERLVGELRALEGRNVDFQRFPIVREAFAEAYAEAGDFESAVHWYREAIASGREPARATLRAIEQLANMEVRLAVGRHRSSEWEAGRVEEGAEALFDLAAKRLAQLHDLGETAERHALRGSLLKKRATTLESAADRREMSARSAEAYRAAWELWSSDGEGPALRGDWIYYGCLAVQMARLAASPQARQLPPESQEILERLIEARRQLAEGASEGDYWERARIADIDATQIVAGRLLTEDVVVGPDGAVMAVTDGDGREVSRPAAQVIAEEFQRAFSIRSTVRQRRSPIDHYRDLGILLANDEERSVAERIADNLGGR